MNKILPSILLSLVSGYAFAATTMTDDLHTGLKYWWDFQTDTKPIDYTSKPPTEGSVWESDFGFTLGNGYGTLESGHTPYNVNTGLKAKSFTLSFDIKDLQLSGFKNIFTIYTDNGILDNHCLSLRSDNSTKNLSLIEKDFGNVNNTSIPTTITSDNWTTFTITGNGSFITLYQDGISVGTLAYVAEDKNITGIQFGCSIAGGNNRPITSAKIDNVGLWNTALTADQVKSLNGLVPEPTTVSLSLVGLAALMLRRRRA